ncbi:hypothetical protein COCNU_scaffold014605G000140 [Cocos nucifera]|nr:hypothetical protein [Cocos nucifera]
MKVFWLKGCGWGTLNKRLIAVVREHKGWNKIEREKGEFLQDKRGGQREF